MTATVQNIDYGITDNISDQSTNCAGASKWYRKVCNYNSK